VPRGGAEPLVMLLLRHTAPGGVKCELRVGVDLRRFDPIRFLGTYFSPDALADSAGSPWPVWRGPMLPALLAAGRGRGAVAAGGRGVRCGLRPEIPLAFLALVPELGQGCAAGVAVHHRGAGGVCGGGSGPRGAGGGDCGGGGVRGGGAVPGPGAVLRPKPSWRGHYTEMLPAGGAPRRAGDLDFRTIR